MGPAMELITRTRGLNSFLALAYDAETNLSVLLVKLGFDPQQVQDLCRIHLEYVAEFLTAFLRERMATYSDGERLYYILSRRFGLDGCPPDTLQGLGQRLGISRERVRQLEEKAVRKCRSKAHRQSFEAGLRAMASVLVGDADRNLIALPLPAHKSGQPASPGAGVPTNVGQSEDTDRADLGNLAELAASVLQSVPHGLTCAEEKGIQCGQSTPGEDRLATLRATYPRAYTPWSEEDDALLEQKHRQGTTIQALSEFFQRQPGAIRSRLAKLGLTSATENE
jgi:hypothetical protein